MSEDDRSKRQKAQNEKRKKLINPLFFVSAHRLSIRNLAKSVTDNELKTLCIAALKTGNYVPRKIEFWCVWNCVFRVYCFRMLYILQYNGLLDIRNIKKKKRSVMNAIYSVSAVLNSPLDTSILYHVPQGEGGRDYFIFLSGYILFLHVVQITT